MMSRLKLGSRASPLALAQAHEAASRIAAANGWEKDEIEIVALTTSGDRIQDRPLAEIGGKALWTKELDRALADGAVDACVHSMKDVESERPANFRIAAILPRADVRDRLIGAERVDDLAVRAIVGTSSPRRAAQLLRRRPDLMIVPMRGNVQTRLAKVTAGEVAATLLAAAGLDRLGITAGSAIAIDTMLPAPGQAAIGIECRADCALFEAIAGAADAPSQAAVAAERAFTAALGGTCHSPVAALAVADGPGLRLRAELYSPEGEDCIADEAHCAAGDLTIPAELARSMLARANPVIRALFEPA
jgi:hydroxymethylbilane synthase